MEDLYSVFLNSSCVSTDTRSLKVGELFFCLSGENFNGNDFIDKALNSGASHVVCSDENYSGMDRVTVVENTLTSLQDLATTHRKTFKFPIIALTGSNGKTTTKELVRSVLSQGHKVEATIGNLNNHIGVPLTLLSFPKDLDFGIVEMGANHQKEISQLCNIALPDYGLITNYGKAHLEGFGGIEGVKKGKSEMFDYLRHSENKAFIAAWDEEQIERSDGIEKIFTSSIPELVESSPYLKIEYGDLIINTSLTGVYNYHNVKFAITIGEYFSLSPEQIKQGIEAYVPSDNRSQIIEKGGCKIILDAYNANPSSMKAALDNLVLQESNYKSAILGDMYELGEYSESEHQKIADYATKLKIDQVYLVGEHFYKTETTAEKFQIYDDFHKAFEKTEKKGITLIKGSRGIKMERSLKLFE